MVDAVLKLYDKYLEPDDLVGYYGLGDGWIFDVQPKGDDDTPAAALRQQIVDSVEKRGAPPTRTREPEPGAGPGREP